MGMRKFACVVILMAGVFCIFAPSSASAHVLKTDNQIGAVLHLEPDDDPDSGTPVTYQLVFNDTSGRLDLRDCVCTMTLKNSTGTVNSETLKADRKLDSRNTVTFPEADVYTLIVRGDPRRAGSFQSFRLSYTVRVSDGDVQFQPVPVLLWTGLGGAVALALLAAFKEDRDYSR